MTDHDSTDTMEQRAHEAARSEVLVEKDELLEEDALVEEISIDGMCGVY
ncbi:mycofactocin precursor MftA [Streptomyces sp. NPDC087903]